MDSMAQSVENSIATGEKIRILLLTHKDSDNIGDQMIELCDLAILQTIMKNLGYTEESYEIISEKAAVVSPEYVKTKDQKLLQKAKQRVMNSDLVMLGGAPQFNYLYQYFSERSVVFLKLAKKYNKPIIFSAIGIENYNPDHPKCQTLKRALAYDCVKMVTTRDNFDDLKRIITNKDVTIARVADPAVMSGQVLRNYRSATSKKIGLFIIRGNAFADNGIDFTIDDAAKMWLSIINEIQSRGYDYELVTSGHYSDEQFMDLLVRKYGVKLSKCVFNMYTPEYLIQKISSYAGVISCRLHPGIISYSLKVPAVGIIWNPKVDGFYKAINHEERTISVENCSPSLIMDKLEIAIHEGVSHDQEYICSIYNSLFNVIKKQFCPDKDVPIYSYDQLMQEIPIYPGTSPESAQEKLRRQVRRCYKNFNMTEEKLRNLREEVKTLKQNANYDLIGQPIQIKYFTIGGKEVECLYSDTGGVEVLFENGGHEYTSPLMLFHNNGCDKADRIQYLRKDFSFVGWNIRVKLQDVWFWLLSDGSLCMRATSVWEDLNDKKYILKDNGIIPVIPLKGIDSIVFEACWLRTPL